MEGKDEVIKELYKTKLIKELMNNMGVKRQDYADLEQEIYVILWEYNTNKIIQMYKKKQLKWFIIKLIQNQYFSINSPFYKNYKKYYRLVDGNVMNGGREQNECCGNYE